MLSSKVYCQQKNVKCHQHQFTFFGCSGQFHAVTFYGEHRSTHSLLDGATKLLQAFKTLASSAKLPCDVTTKDLRLLLKELKVGRCKGIVDVPWALQCSSFDLWSDWRNVRALELWQCACAVPFPEWLEEHGVVINMRVACPLRQDGKLDLLWLLPEKATYVVTDASGKKIEFSSNVSVSVLPPGSRIFVRHLHIVNPGLCAIELF
jgi:hypothetical protein